MRTFPLRHLIPAFLSLVVLAFSACSKSSAPGGSSSAPAASPDGKKVLRVGNGSEPQDLDPHTVTGVPEHHLILSLLEGLVTEHPSGVGVSPGVAETWETSSDGLTWTFHLRANAKWSNGDPVTARDFVGSYRRILTPAIASEYSYFLYNVVGAEEFNKGTLTDFAQTGFSAPDDHTLVLRLKAPVPYLLESLKHSAWFPVHLPTIEKFGGLTRRGTAWTRPENFVGNGPFILKQWLPNQKIAVERSPTYWDAATVKLDRIEFFAVESDDAEERMFRAGQLHVTNTIPLSRIDVYKKNQPELLRIEPNYATYFYRFNVTRPPLNDVRVRRALALAIDREMLIKRVTRGEQEPAYNYTPPSPTYTARARLNEGCPTYSAAIAEARRLLAEAGYPEGKGLRRIELLYNTLEGHKQIAEAIQAMWKQNLGLDVVLHNEEWKVFIESTQTLNYDIARAGWNADFPDPMTFVDQWVTGGGNNNTGYSSPEYDRVLASALTTGSENGRFEVYQQLDALLVRDLPILPIYFYKRLYLIQPKVKNWVPNILDNRSWKYIDLAE